MYRHPSLSHRFALRGNVLDLAIGIIIGTAFQNVVKSLVNDILTPPFGFIFDGVDLSNLTVKMQNFVRKDQPPVVIRYGVFMQQILHLLVVALALFSVVKFIRRLKKVVVRRRPPIAPSEPSQPSQAREEVRILTEIRDLIAARTDSMSPPPITVKPTDSSPNLITLVEAC